MSIAQVTRHDFLEDLQGKTFGDVANDPHHPFDIAIDFFNDADRQRRMEESELHHDRSPLAGVIREFESQSAIDQFLAGARKRHSIRFRQAIGVLVRMIMERRGWKKAAKKGSLGVRATGAEQSPTHNTGGLAFWFIRAERYKRSEGMPFRTVRERCRELKTAAPCNSQNENSQQVQREVCQERRVSQENDKTVAGCVKDTNGS